MKKYYLVTGGAGFIGSHVVDLLLKNNKKVKVIDNLSSGSLKNLLQHKNNKNLLFKKIDIRKIRSNENFLKNCFKIIHLAGIGDIVPSINHPKKYFDVNVNGTLNLLEYFKNKKIEKFVYAASSSCYGKSKFPTKEENRISTLHPYALSKYMGEQLCIHWHNIYNFPLNSIRIFNAYGTRSKTTGAYGAVIGVFLKQMLMSKPLTVVGNGKQKRDFLYVTDVAEAFYKASNTKLKGKIWNLGFGKAYSVNKLIEKLKYKKKIFIPNRPGEPEVTLAVG
jgi:UDP-glucose 4-epimerase